MCRWCLDAKDEELGKLFHDVWAAVASEEEADREQNVRKAAQRRKKRQLDRTRKHTRKRELLEDATCHYCDQPATTIDHIVPRAKGGPKWNLKNWIQSCTTCNEKKGDKLPTCPCDVCQEALELFWRAA